MVSWTVIASRAGGLPGESLLTTTTTFNPCADFVHTQNSRTFFYLAGCSVVASRMALTNVPVLVLPESMWLFPFATVLSLLPPWSDALLEVGAVTYLGWVIVSAMAFARISEVIVKIVLP